MSEELRTLVIILLLDTTYKMAQDPLLLQNANLHIKTTRQAFSEDLRTQ